MGHNLDNALKRIPGRERVRPSSIVAFVLVLVVGSAVSLATMAEVHRQEDSLIRHRGEQAGADLTLLLAELQEDLRPLGPIVDTRNIDPTAFHQQTATLLAGNPGGSVSVIRTIDGAPAVVFSDGDQQAVGQPVPSDVAAALVRVNQLPPSNVLRFASTPISTDARGVRSIGLAYRDANFPANTDLWVQLNLAPLSAAAAQQNPSFSRNNVTLYENAPETPQNIVLTTAAPNGNHTGPVYTSNFAIGGNNWLLTVQSKTYLTDTITHFLAWIVFGLSILLAIAVAVAVEAVQRRNEYAMTLVDERTAELSESIRVHKERSTRDALLRRTARDVASAPNLAVAFATFCETLNDIVVFDRANFSLVDERVARIVAVGGAMAQTLPIGTVFAKTDDLVARAIETSQSEIAYIDTEVATAAPQMRTRMAVPIIVAGELHALFTVASTKPEAFHEDDLQNVERLLRETSAPLYLLMVLDREREASKRLQQLDQLKSDFVGMVAHDLRSPMTVISGFADFLRSHLDSLSADETSLYLQRISESTKHLSAFIEDVLQVARIEANELHIDIAEFNLGILVKRIVEELALSHSDRTLLVDVAPDLPPALGDEARQWQIINNLILNALKFSEGIERPIEVKVAHDAKSCSVSVTDYGIGIEPEELTRIFDKFYRVEQHRNRTTVAGTGLGLYICKSLVEAQGGTITATSSPEAGTTFTYTVPFVIRTNGQSQSGRDNAPTARGATSELGRPGQ